MKNADDKILKRKSAGGSKSIFDIDETSVNLSSDSDSDSSSDNFPKANKLPFISDEQISPKNETLETTESISDNGKQINAQSEIQISDVTELYDFSNILKSQEEITVLAKQLAKSQPINSAVRTRLRKTRKTVSKTPRQNDVDSIDVKELLRIGEKSMISDDESEECEVSEDTDSDNENKELKTVEFTIPEPNMFNQPRKKSNHSEEAEFKRYINLKRRQYQLILHKAHLICLIASGNFINSVLNCDELQAIALSLIPSNKFYPPGKSNKSYISQLLSWFCKMMKPNSPDRPPDPQKTLREDLIDDYATCTPRSRKNMVLFFIIFCRVLGLRCRLVINVNPVSIKPPALVTDQPKPEKPSENEPSSIPENSNKSPVTNEPIKSNKNSVPGTNKNKKKKDTQVKKDEPKTTRSDSSLKKKNSNVKNGVNKMNIKETLKRKVLSSDEDSDHLMSPPKKKMNKNINNIWAEVYLESEKKWMCVDVVRNRVNCANLIYECCSTPVSYILAWNEEGTFKDVTRRYVPQWHLCLKTRIDASWWNRTLRPWKPLSSSINKQEDEELERKVEESPFPTSIGEFKNHPCFVLKRHLLKFQAIYPPTAVPLGRIKNEDIYARACVVELHTKESWIKEAKVVRENQEPYKVVKARPKREKGTNKLIKDLPLNIYGHWQVDDYIPPTAVDGKVPRNEFGNVELYKPSMIPKGTVHLQLPGLMRVAKKLDIDCAHAVVGWEFRGCGSHPVIDGVVVCEEFKQKLLDAWNRDIDDTEKRTRENREKRAITNWRKMIRAILLRNQLKGKYEFKFNERSKKTK